MLELEKNMGFYNKLIFLIFLKIYQFVFKSFFYKIYNFKIQKKLGLQQLYLNKEKWLFVDILVKLRLNFYFLLNKGKNNNILNLKQIKLKTERV
jgi:hypothetical protein